MAGSSFDSRLARACIAPLAQTRVHPNHLTALSLAIGLLGAASYASGGRTAMALGALLYMLSMFADHMDGELARLTGQTSEFGHKFDRASDLVVKSIVFTAMGVGIARTSGAALPILQGVAAGAAFVSIFVLHDRISSVTGEGVPDQPAAGGFEIEDILYLIGPVTWLGFLPAFLVIASIGAPLYAAFVFSKLRLAIRSRD
ncbi:MAG: CDP-alcohol phosphatidyltransferase family protein [bacterium]